MTSKSVALNLLSAWQGFREVLVSIRSLVAYAAGVRASRPVNNDANDGLMLAVVL